MTHVSGASTTAPLDDVAPPNATTEPAPETKPRKRDYKRLAIALVVEAALLAALLSCYRWVRYLLDGQVSIADANAEWIWKVERWLRLPNEVSLQHWALDWEPLARLCNGFYVSAHFPAMIALLAWLFIWKPSAYSRVRMELVILTASGLLIHALFPLTPPRLAPGIDAIDTMKLVGPSAYPAHNDGIANQYAAMPSLHVGWAILIAIAVTRVLHTRARWLIWLHPAVTIFVVVVTANHYWMDGIVATVLLVGAIGGASVVAKTLETARSKYRLAFAGEGRANEEATTMKETS